MKNGDPIETDSQLKIKIVSILVGVLLACPPYIHIFLDYDSTKEVFGYYNLRTFWLAAGEPFTILFVSTLLLLKVLYKNSESVHSFAKYSVFSFLTTGFMFSVKPFVPRNDFHQTTYYIALFITSIFLAFGLFWSITKLNQLRKKKFSEIFQFLVVKTWSAEKGIIHKALMAGFKSGMKKDIAFEEFEQEQDAWEEELDELIQKYGKG